MQLPHQRGPIHDVLGVGLGPANLALFAALVEGNEYLENPIVLESRGNFVWHPGMLMPGVRCQITFLKDLATLRDPTSSFTFLNYLHEKGRLSEFINLRDPFPSRIEFNDYLSWVADKLADHVQFDQRVRAVETGERGSDGSITNLRVISEDSSGETTTRTAKHVVVGSGATPWLPDGVEVGERIVHSSQFRLHVDGVLADPKGEYDVAVVGAGQSAAEIAYYIVKEFPNARVSLMTRQPSLRPLDESPFVNELFTAPMLHRFFDLSSDLKQSVLNDMQNASYAVVDQSLLETLSTFIYQERLHGRDRLQILPLHSYTRSAADEKGVNLTFRDLIRDQDVDMRADMVVFATGYRQRRRLSFLEPLVDLFELDSAGEYELAWDFSVQSRDELKAKVFLQGFGEDTHGIGEPQLSNMAFHAGFIAARLAEALPYQVVDVREHQVDGDQVDPRKVS